jgi:hypothetical protein
MQHEGAETHHGAPAFPLPSHLTPEPAADPLARLRAVYQAGEAVDPQVPEVARILQRVAAGVVECQLMSRLSVLHRLWPDPLRALAKPALCRQLAGVGSRELERAGEMLGATIVSAVNETASFLDGTFDPEAWAGVLTQILKPVRPVVGGSCEVHDIETLRLIRADR